jgi:hypothetical protein
LLPLAFFVILSWQMKGGVMETSDLQHHKKQIKIDKCDKIKLKTSIKGHNLERENAVRK